MPASDVVAGTLTFVSAMEYELSAAIAWRSTSSRVYGLTVSRGSDDVVAVLEADRGVDRRHLRGRNDLLDALLKRGRRRS